MCFAMLQNMLADKRIALTGMLAQLLDEQQHRENELQLRLVSIFVLKHLPSMHKCTHVRTHTHA